jgi:arabinogalactan oligomer/maltooligosaccharide transport system substrate-binding protein
MNKKLLLALGILLAGLMLAACGGSTPAAPSGDQAEAATITIWHSFTGTENDIFDQVVKDFQAANPDVTVNVLAVPFDELQNKFQTEAASGTGPTLIIDPQDRMAVYNDAGLLAPIDTVFKDVVGLEGGQIGGTQVGIPINNKVLTLLYNKSMVSEVPSDWDGLLADAAAGNGIALTADWFHNYMWLPAFGATLLDGDSKAVVDSAEAAAALDYYATVCGSEGVTCDADDGAMDTLFRQGEVAYRVQGPWASGDYVKDLGAENVGVAKIPAIPGQKEPRPWNQSQMIMLNVNAPEAEAAAAKLFINTMVSSPVQAMFLEKANWIPVNTTVDTASNPVVGGFLAQVPTSDPFPVVKELGATWEPMGNAVTKILAGTPAADALKEANDLINTANGK